MISILVSNTKGGSGKTTVATNLAAAFARGGFVTALADADRQKSALDWLKRRSEELPPITALDWSKDVGSVPKKVQRLVVDAPAGQGMGHFRELLKLADVVLMPVLPSAFDRAATKRFIQRIEEVKPVRKGRKPVALIANRTRVRTRAAEALKTFLAEIGHPATGELHDQIVYGDAAEAGVSIFDRKDKAARTAQADWTPIITFVEVEGD